VGRQDGGDGSVLLYETFPFTDTAAAYKYLESNAQIGKIVITIP